MSHTHNNMYLWIYVEILLTLSMTSLLVAFSRNPGLEKQLFAYAILGFALTEAIALFCLMMAFLILFGV